MASKDTNDAAASAKKRILSHMNKDHSDSIAKYVEHYNGASRWTSRNAQLKDITNNALIIQAGTGSDYTIPLKPPMNGLMEARQRLMQMDTECNEALGASPYTVKKYVPPTGFHLVVFLASLISYIMLSRESHVLPGSIAYRLYLNPLGLAGFAHNFRLAIFVGMIVIHGTEAYFMAAKMRKHSVPLFSRLWFLWVGSNFIEGFGAFQRLDAVVAQQKADKEKASH